MTTNQVILILRIHRGDIIFGAGSEEIGTAADDLDLFEKGGLIAKAELKDVKNRHGSRRILVQTENGTELILTRRGTELANHILDKSKQFFE